MSHQTENIAAYELLTNRGFEVKVPDGARCNMCPAPHLPYHPLCMKCSEELDVTLIALDQAWTEAVNPFKEFDGNLMRATCEVLQAWRKKQAAFREKG